MAPILSMMSSSSLCPDDPHRTRNIVHLFRTRLVARFYRQYVFAALGNTVYRPTLVLPLWAGLLLFAVVSELLPGDSSPIVALSAFHVNDKFIHFSTYAVIALVPAYGLRFRTAASCVVTTELVGIGLEVAQLFVRGRSCDPYDLLANTVGVLAGMSVALFARSRLGRSLH